MLSKLLGWISNERQEMPIIEETANISWKEYERREHEKGYEEGSDEDSHVSIYRTRGRAAREEIEHVQSSRLLKG